MTDPPAVNVTACPNVRPCWYVTPWRTSFHCTTQARVLVKFPTQDQNVPYCFDHFRDIRDRFVGRGLRIIYSPDAAALIVNHFGKSTDESIT